ncbi:Sulfatase-modifying factor enzyme 1 [Sporobacter termitidis DSM 10068]|uniref:Sulfatase-modifying factor enzyme 1 n=1 Tax=Sporobacter termitidis DSM 10068 TaxID=1123282 RepID=A0A1M5XK65_9FIRM|nr:SUMF1/EgtB/PvdO family nonheme iron enzyme [Sporobacter termitidis]SHI00210.1 Sulfatase-modifying factor enzyme 1 [Sporobacter termitidis DSM 10068]
MGRFDEARFALEAMSGGKNTLLMDDMGLPSVMVRIPCFRWSEVYEEGEDTVCSAFIVDGKVKDSIYISKYLNVVERGRAYSLPDRDPAHTITIDDAREACARKGPGWHLMSNAEWAALAHWCRKNGTLPRGNTNAGRDVTAVHEHGVLAPPSGIGAGKHPEARTLTGSGPDAWSHDWTAAGITDLVGNVWDMVSGLRLVDGEIQIIPDNDSAMNVDESEKSPLWRAVDTSGNLVAPGSPNTYKYDGVNPGSPDDTAPLVPGGVRLGTSVRQPQYTGPRTDADYFAWTMMPFRSMAADVAPHVLLKALGLYPLSERLGGDNFFVRNYGERLPLRGGSWLDGASAGLWELYLRDSRSWIFPDVGFRAAYVEL